MAERRTKLSPKANLAALSGNVLEWYDFTVYSFLAPILAQVFFPGKDSLTSLLSAFAVLAVGYLARPIGSVIFGHVGDRFGRKPALMISVLLMGLGSLAISVLPSHAQIGLAAPLLLIVIRIVQGVAVAGEFTASGVLMVEEAAPNHRGLMGSWMACAMMAGCLLGSGVPTLFTNILSDAQMADWGWRLPFALGTGVAALSLASRLALSESSALAELVAQHKAPLKVAFQNHGGTMVYMVLLLIPTGVIYFVIFVYASTYLTKEMHFSTAQAMDITTINLVIFAAVVPIVGYISDRVGRRAVYMAGAMGIVVLTIPFWSLMHSESLTTVYLGQLGLTILDAIPTALAITVLCEMVPTAVRCSAVAIGYNLCLALFGGTTPAIATYLVSRTGDDFAPAYYIIAGALLSLIAAWRLPKLIARAKAAEGKQTENL